MHLSHPSPMSPSPFLDVLSSDVTALKHNTMVLHNENIEIRQNLMSCSKFHTDFSKDITLLKQTMTQILSQNSLFQSALQELAKEIKFLKRENIQIRSKYDILQVRIKSIQGSQDHDISPKNLSARKFHGSPFKSDDGQFDFQFTSRLDNIVNQSTRNRLESLRKDLEGVLRGEEEKIEPTKEEKDAMTIMEEWSNPSELNISQTQSDRLTTVMHNAGDNTFGANPSLMEQLDMLSVQQGSPKSPFEVESTADNSTFSRAVTFSFGGAKVNMAAGGKFGENLSTLQTISDGSQNQQARQNHARSQAKNKSLESHHNNMAAMSPVQTTQKLTVGGKVVPQLKLYGAGSQGVKGGDTISTFGGGETATSLQKFSSEPSYLMDSRSEEIAQKQKNKQVEAVPPVHFGTMDIKTKKELYLRGDNMLMGVLDRLEETVHKGGSPLLNTNGSSNNQQETFRIQVNPGRNVEQNYYFAAGAKGDHVDSEQDRIKRVHSSENAGNNTINSGRGTTKKLRLGKLSMKGKDGLTSLHESLSSNTEI